MWYVLSFTGKFDPAFFEKLHPPPPPTDEPTEEQRKNNKLAVEARSWLRLAERYSHLRDMIREGRCRDNTVLTETQEELLPLYGDGTLLEDANRLSHISSNGRRQHWHGSFVDLGGSTGGFTRTVLYDWQPPDLTQFESVDPADVEPDDPDGFELVGETDAEPVEYVSARRYTARRRSSSSST